MVLQLEDLEICSTCSGKNVKALWIVGSHWRAKQPSLEAEIVSSLESGEGRHPPGTAGS